MKVRRSVLALGAFFVVAIAAAGCGSGVPGNSVADVAGNPITTQAFNHWMFVVAKSQASQVPGQPVIVPNDPPNFNKCIAQVRKQFPTLAKTSTKTLRSDCKNLYTSLSSTVMDFLIKAYWYQAEAAKLHVKVTDADVEKVFTQAKNQEFPKGVGFSNFLAQSGETLQDILYRFRINVTVQKLVAKHNASVTQAQIQNYYNAHPSAFSTPQSRTLRVVLAPSQARALAAKKALDSGQSWTAVAKKYSIDPSKNTGGLLSGLTKQQMEPALAAVAFSAPVNKVLGPVKGQFGYYVIDVVQITPATHQTLSQVSSKIRQTLIQQQQSNAQAAVESHVKKDWLNQTTCRSQYAMADCKGYKAPKTATTGSTTGTSTG
jgi:foldase protein PrsA